jgi:O-antigen ligase
MKKGIIFLLLFVLFYLEPIQIGPLTFSQLWKIPFFLFLFFNVFLLIRNKKPNFIRWSYYRASKNLITSGLVVSYVAQIVDFLRYMMFPLMYEYANSKIKTTKQVDKLLLGFAQFIILSGLPFVLGLIDSLGREILFNEEFSSFVGLFQNPHAASITTSISILIILYFLKSKTKTVKFRFLNYLLVALGMYLLFLTFVRTGFVMFFLGVLVLFWPSKITFKQILISVVFFASLLIGFFYLLETNELFYNRIFDIRKGNQTELGSGRLTLWQTTFELWKNGDYFELIFGYGYEGLTEKTYEVTGTRLVGHSEIFTQLGQNGLLGVLGFIGFSISLFTYIRGMKNSKVFRLAITTLSIYVLFMFTQGGAIFHFDIVMLLILIKLKLENTIIKSPSK